MSLRDLKQNRAQELEKIAEGFKKQSARSSEGYEDDRFWYPAVDKIGNGIATIRFLPAIDSEPSPIVKVYRHAFQGPTGKWYINNCLSTLKQDDPVLKHNNKLCGGKKWEQVPDNIKKIVSAQKRKTEYITNIYVVEDKANPENEGKVFLFRFGPQIYNIIMDKMYPKFEGDTRIMVFDPWGPDAESNAIGGANFKLKIYLKDKKNRNYERSEFEPHAALFPNDKNDANLEEVFAQRYPLQPFIAPDQFKPYAELQAKLNEVLGLDQDDDNEVEEAPESRQVESRSSREAKPAWEADDDEVDENFFKTLVEE